MNTLCSPLLCYNVQLKFILDCRCSDFIDTNGFGKCKKTWKKGPICFVKEPSKCTDQISVGKKHYSWEACNLEKGKCIRIDKLMNMKSLVRMKLYYIDEYP